MLRIHHRFDRNVRYDSDQFFETGPLHPHSPPLGDVDEQRWQMFWVISVLQGNVSQRQQEAAV